MMPGNHRLVSLMAGLAAIEWLLNRLIARVGIFIPKTPAMITIYEGLEFFGRFVGSLTAVLAFGFLSLVIVNAWRERQPALAITLSLTATATVYFLFIAPMGWLPVVTHGFFILALIIFMAQILRSHRLGFTLMALSALIGETYLALPGLYQALRIPGPPPAGLMLFGLGEGLALAGAILLGSQYWMLSKKRVKAVALIPAVMFLAIFHINPSLTGIMAIWSTGFTLFLPPYLYALALYGLGLGIMVSWRSDPAIWAAILMLISSGYAPQLSLQRMLLLGAFALAGGQITGTSGNADSKFAALPSSQNARI